MCGHGYLVSEVHAMQLFTMEDGTFPALLKMLTDTSPEVVMQDLVERQIILAF